MAADKIEKISLMKEDKLKEIAFSQIKELMGEHYEICERNVEIIEEGVEWSEYLARHLYRQNVNLVKSFPLKMFYDESTRELIGMFDGYEYDTKVQSKDTYIFNIDIIVEQIQSDIKIFKDAKIYKKEVMDHDMINVDVLEGVVFPSGKYLYLEWRHKDSVYFQKQLDENSSDIKYIDNISRMFVEVYYNLDTKRLTYFFKNWKIKNEENEE